MSKSAFERHPKLTIASLLAIGAVLVFALAELTARLFGLGQPVIYHAHPIYGYRPEPNQLVSRNRNLIQINNLSLRADRNWDLSRPENKVLFLGDSVTYGGSYVANDKLFSHLAVKPFSHYLSGNAGVNGWGIDNVSALIKDMQFLPADIYISTFPEGDFYRGLMRIGGQPFWSKKPQFALEELFQYFVYKLHLKKTPAAYFYTLPQEEKCRIAELAVLHLKELDDYLKANHRTHIIFISPSRSQVLGMAGVDPCLEYCFAKYNLRVIYINDKLPKISDQERSQWFHDEIHLSVLGHQKWAQVISNELTKIIPQDEEHAYSISASTNQ